MASSVVVPLHSISRRLEQDGIRALESYLLDCEVRGLSKRTIKWYKETLLNFLKWMKRNQGVDSPETITGEVIGKFIVGLRDNNNNRSPWTINGYLRSLKGWFSFLVQEEVLSANPMKKIRLLKVPQTVFPSLKPEHVNALLKLQNLKTFVGTRNYAILLLFIDGGIRLSELTGLRIQDVDLEARLIKVFGKGSKERVVPFGLHTKKALMKYLNWREGEPSEPLFISRTGKSLKPRSIQDWLKEDAKKAGITGIRVSPHTFRHSFAVQFLRNGGDAFSLQRILGHTDPKGLRNLCQDGSGRVARSPSKGFSCG